MSSNATLAPITAYAVDPAHSTVGFRVRHLGFTKVPGHFATFEASIRLDPDDISTLQVEAEIGAASVSTANEQRDRHLRSADFFNAEAHPTIRFESTGVSEIFGDTFTLEGNLTIKGVTRGVSLKARYLGRAVDPWGGARVAFEANGKIDRTDYGLAWNTVLASGGLLVAEEVELLLEVQGVEQ